MIGAVLKLIIFTSMVNRIINTSRNERVTQQIYDTYLSLLNCSRNARWTETADSCFTNCSTQNAFCSRVAIIVLFRHRPREKRGVGLRMRMRTKLEHLLFHSIWGNFCVRFESRNGRLKPLQSFWYTLYVSRNNYTAYLRKPVLFGIQFAVERGNTPLSNGICHDDSPFFGVLKKRSAQKDSVAMDHYELHVRRIRGASGDCNSRAGTAQKVYTLRFRGYLNPTRLCFGDGCSVFVRQEV